MFKNFNIKFSLSATDCLCGTVVCAIAFVANSPGSNHNSDCFLNHNLYLIIMFLI